MRDRPRNFQYSKRTGAGIVPEGGSRRVHGARADWALNVRLLVWTVVVLVITAPTLYAVRTVQVRRNAGILFDRAQTFESEGDLTAAGRTLFRYVQFRPDDGPARVMLAEVFDKTATTFVAKRRATEHYYQALSYFEDRVDLRTRLAELLLELDHSADAERESLRVLFGSSAVSRAEAIAGLKGYQDRLQAPKLLASNTDAPRALEVLAKACFVNGSTSGGWPPADQLTAVKSALAANPESIELALLQAKIYRERLLEPAAEDRARLADELLTEMISVHPEVGRAHLALYRYRVDHQLPEADAALEKALSAAPEDYEVLLAAAGRAHSQAKLDDASAYYKRTMKLASNDPRPYAGFAQLLYSQGKPREGVAVCGNGLKRCGADDVRLNLVLLQGWIQSGELGNAKDVLAAVKRKQESIGPLLKLTERMQLRDTIALLEAEYAIASKQFLRAVAILRQLTLPRSGEQSYLDDRNARSQRWHRLAQVYEQVHYWGQAAKAYEEAAALGTADYAPLTAAGRAWQSAGRYDAAVAAFNAALQSDDAQPDGWVLLARAEIERQMRLAERDWTTAESVLQEAERLLGNSPTVAILNIEILKLKGNQSAALEALARAVESDPKEVLPFAALFYQAANQDQRAGETLEQLKRLSGEDDREVRALEMDLCRRQKNYDRCKALFDGLIAETQPADKYDLRRQMALMEMERGAVNADEQLLALAKDYPDRSWPLERLADRAMSNRDYGRLAEFEDALKKLEGDDGSLWRFYRAMRLIGQTQGAADDRFAQAVRLQNDLQALRPLWPSTLQLKGRIAQQQGRVEEAAEAYQAAIEAGATSVTVLEGLVALLYANNRWLEADAFLSRLQQVGQHSPTLESLSSRLYLRQGEFDQAVMAAQSGVGLRPKDPLAHIWLGQTLVVGGNRQNDPAKRREMIVRAKDSFDTAVSLAPDDFRTWSGSLWYYARIGDKQAAARALEGLKTKARLTEPQRLLALAQAHQLLGDYRSAEEHYRTAVQMLPNDPATQERLAQFYLTYAPEKAEQALRRLLEIAPSSKGGRRALATLLVTQGASSQFEEALKLLRTSEDDAADRRLQALLLMQRGGKENLGEARRLLEELLRQAIAPNPTDRHLLALVAEMAGDTETAKGQLTDLAADTGSAAYLATLIEFLLRHDQPQGAREHVKRLTEIEPSSLRTTQLTTKWMQAAGRPVPEIIQTVRKYEAETLKMAQDDRQRLAVVSRVVGLYTQLAMHDEAKNCWKRFLQSYPGDQARQVFALWLMKTDQLADAVQLAMDGAEGDAPTDAGVQLLSNVLTFAATRGMRFPAAESRVDELVRGRSENANLLFELATLRHMQGKSDAARRLYERSIQLSPANAFARNNLAMLLVDVPGASRESLAHIEEALRIAGPLAELRDTHAVVLAHSGQAEEACRILRTLVAHSPRNARYLFHLAVACHKADDRDAAAEALAKAEANRLDSETMTPEERRLLVELRAVFGGASDS